MPLVFVVSAADAGRMKGFAPMIPEPATKVSVEFAVRVKAPPRLSVATPTPPPAALALRIEVPPVREMSPSVTEPSAPLRLMNSKAPPSSWRATSDPKRLDIAWMPESSQRSRLLRMLTVSPAVRPENLP